METKTLSSMGRRRTTGDRPGARRGASFLEVMVVVVIVAVAMVPFMDYLSQESRGASSTIGRTVALDLAHQVIERYRTTPPNDLKAFFGPSTASTPDSEDILNNDDVLRRDSFTPAYKKMIQDFKYVRKVTFEEAKNGTNRECLGILKIQVSWTVPALKRQTEVQLARFIVDEQCLGEVMNGI